MQTCEDCRELLKYFQSPASGPGTGKEVIAVLEETINFLVAVAASVIGTYICKWLDGHSKGD